MRTQPSQQRSRQTVRALLHAANEEFAEHGYDGAQMTRIAARSEVSVGSMYRFFPDKESFARALVDEYGQAMVVEYRKVLAGFIESHDVEEAVAGLVQAAARLQLAHGGYYRLAATVLDGDTVEVSRPVRTLLVDTVVDHMVQAGHLVGATPEEQERREDHARVVVNFIMDISRTGLSQLPRSGDERDAALAELERMVVLYAMDRLE